MTINSWGCPASEGCNSGNWATMQSALAAQRAAGIVTVASAGNPGSSCGTVEDPPAIFDEAFSVGSFSASTLTIASSSSRGPVTVDGSNRPKPDLAAPGVSVRSAYLSSDTSHATMSGTSMAGPHAAGAVALLLSAVPALAGDVDGIERRLGLAAVPVAVTNTCSSNGSPNNVWGSGRLDAACAVTRTFWSVTIGVTGSTTIGSPCVGGTAGITDAGGGTGTYQWGYRSTAGGPVTPLSGQTGAAHVLTCSHFPGPGTYRLVLTETSTCGAPVVSNEVAVTVASAPVELQTFQVE